MQPTLAGQTALVTGASAGIGHATALALARAGADLAINYLTYAAEAGALAEQVRSLGRRAALQVQAGPAEGERPVAAGPPPGRPRTALASRRTGAG